MKMLPVLTQDKKFLGRVNKAIVIIIILFNAHFINAKELLEKPDDWFIPEGVVYKELKKSKLKKEIKKIGGVFKKKQLNLYKYFKSFDGMVFIGGFLTQQIHSIDEKAKFNLTRMNYKIPLDKETNSNIYGILAKTKPEKKYLAILIESIMSSDTPVVIRRLTPEEIAFMWFFISWDIKEPIFLIESGAKRFIFDIGVMNSNMLWIEEISEPCFQMGIDDYRSPCLCNKIIFEDKKWDMSLYDKENSCSESIDLEQTKIKDIDRLQNYIKLDSVEFLDRDERLKRNLSAEILSSFIESVEDKLNTIPNDSNEGLLKIKINLNIKQKHTFEISYQGNISESMLFAIESMLNDVETLQTKNDSINFILIFTVN